MNDDHMQLWNQVCTTDPTFTKPDKRFGGSTAIDPHWQLRTATALWGPYGVAWGLREIRFETIPQDDSRVGIWCHATFYFPDGSFPVSADLLYRAGDEQAAKLTTRCISLSLKRLGFSADVFMGRFDDIGYVRDVAGRFSDASRTVQQAYQSILTAPDNAFLDKCAERVTKLVTNKAIELHLGSELLAAVADRRLELAQEAQPKEEPAEEPTPAEVE